MRDEQAIRTRIPISVCPYLELCETTACKIVITKIAVASMNASFDVVAEL